MKLYNVPQRQDIKVRILPDNDPVGIEPPAHRLFKSGEILTFSHVDGMYSVCHDSEGKLVQLFAGAEVEIIE